MFPETYARNFIRQPFENFKGFLNICLVSLKCWWAGNFPEAPLFAFWRYWWTHFLHFFQIVAQVDIPWMPSWSRSGLPFSRISSLPWRGLGKDSRPGCSTSKGKYISQHRNYSIQWRWSLLFSGTWRVIAGSTYSLTCTAQALRPYTVPARWRHLISGMLEPHFDLHENALHDKLSLSELFESLMRLRTFIAGSS